MAAWTQGELDSIGSAEEIRITAPGIDGSRAAAIPIWIVRVGDDLFIRSYHGTGAVWYRRAMAAGFACIDAGGVAVDVDVAVPSSTSDAVVDAEYRRKYARYGNSYLPPMIAAAAQKATLVLRPRVSYE